MDLRARKIESTSGSLGLGRVLSVCAAVLLGGLVPCGCGSDGTAERKPVVLPSPYPTLPAKNVPAFMKGTIFELTDVENQTPYLVSGYGMVVGLNTRSQDMPVNVCKEKQKTNMRSSTKELVMRLQSPMKLSLEQQDC